MDRVQIPLTGDRAIIQGETYRVSVTFPGDLTDWIPRGQIRTKLLQESGELLAEFAFDSLTYDLDTDLTTVPAYLTPPQTAILPKTRWQGTGEPAKTAVYYYDLELESPSGEVTKTTPAIVQVIGEVTGGADAPPIIPPGHNYLLSDNNLSDVDDPEIARENLGIDDLIGTTIQPYDPNTVIDSGYLPFTQGEKDKLAGIEDGAQANINPEWDAIQNKPSTFPPDAHTHPYEPLDPTIVRAGDLDTALYGYETSSQLNARDTANRDRINHTGTQPASTISDFQSTVSANPNVSANTAERHPAVTVTDSSRIDLTLAGQNITADIVPGSIGTAQLSSGVNASLGLANTAVQPSGIANFETTTQLNNRDTANRNRGNHTGTQAISTVTGLQTALDAKANLSSPALTGTPTAPTATTGTNTTQIATTQFVRTATATLESILGTIAPTGGVDVAIQVPLAPYGVNAYTYTNQALLGRHFPYPLIVSAVRLTLDTAPTGSVFEVDIKKNGVSIFSTRLTVDANEQTSATAAIPSVFSNSLTQFAAGDLITFDVTQVGATTPGRYPVLTIEGVRGETTAIAVPLSPLGVNAIVSSNLALLGRSLPYDFLIENIILTLDTAPTGSSFIVNIKDNGASIFSTLLSVDANEQTSVTAATPFVLSSNTLTKGDLITFDITQIGATAPGRYPVVTLIGRKI